MHMGRFGHVGADAMAGTVLAGMDVFPEMTLSQS